MGKVAQSSVKYVIEAKLKSSGIVEKPDVVGAIFGQTEGLMGEELDLRELQERGRLGRINVEVEEENGSSTAVIQIPTSLDATETALLGASLETIERVGPTNSDIRVEKIKDQRTSKRDYIVKRAKQLLKDIEQDKPGKNSITSEVREEVRTTELTDYRGFKAGPDAETSQDVVMVEGRADVLNLLKHGVKNTVAIGGTSVPENITAITQEKDTTAFLDGDRGGDLILRELKEKADPDYFVKAPENKEVEELEKEQIFSALRDKEPVKYADTGVEKDEIDPEKRRELTERLEDLVGTRAVHILNEELETVDKIPLNRLKQEGADECYAVILDGEIDGEVVSKMEDKTDYIVGMSRDGYTSSSKTEILTREQLGELKATD